MPRVGRHPLKTKDIKEEPILHQKVTVTTIVYIPMLSGYWQESMEVLKLFFDSLHANTGLPFDLMVFDNGSCEEIQNYLLGLKHAGRIQYLVFSQKNLRKLGALNYLLSSAPGEYVAYADSDVYFLPGWLNESLKVLDAFPQAGKVTALPMVGGDASENAKRVFDLAQTDPTIEINTGLLVPEMYVEAHRLSLGQVPNAFASRTAERKDVSFKRNGVEAILLGADFHFVITTKVLQAILPLRMEKDSDYYDPIYSPVLEHRLEDAGFWQLSTPGYFVHHMGNKIPDFGRELPWLEHGLVTVGKSEVSNRSKGNRAGWVRQLVKSAIVRRVLTRLHLISYRLLYDS